MVARRCRWEEFLETTKPFEISKHDVVRAWQLVKANKGAHGVDGETIEQFESDLKNSLYKIWNRMSSGSYFPPAVKTVAIPKKAGGERKLGIPTVSDRVAQMVVKLHFEPLVEPCFHPDSYGYRPNKSAHQALDITRRRCWRYDWVLEFDIKGLFDNIDHELLMKAVRRHTNNRWLTLYIERWLTAPIQQEDGTIIARKRGVPQGGVISPVLSNLFMHYAFDKWMERNCPAIPFCRYADDGLAQAGIFAGGLVTARKAGTPQGGPLSPLLSNILLTDLDKELEKRGHKFCRYADDCNIYVRSEEAGQRVLGSITEYLESTLKLKVNREKSGVGRPWERTFLGYTVCSRKYNVRLKVSAKAVRRFKGDLKAVFRRGRGCSLRKTVEVLNPKLRGWMSYFREIGVKGVLQELDGWLRRHLRKLLWRHWKSPKARYRKLLRVELSKERARISAYNGRGAWWNAGAPHMNQMLPKKLFDGIGLISLVDYNQRLKCLT